MEERLPRFRPPKEIRSIAEVLGKAGHRTYIVGGALRDHFLHRKDSGDIDLATDASPEQVLSLFRRVVPTGIKHGTVTILMGDLKVETTTLREEKGFTDGRRPDSVDFVADIEIDLARRDFTMNAMALELPSLRLYDPFDGRRDIADRTIRSVGDPAERFAEDGLRPLRALRFAAQLGFRLEPRTSAAIGPSLPVFRKVSAERVRDELSKLLLAQDPLSSLRLLEATGLLGEILPELIPSRGCLQKGLHRFDVLDHLFLAVAASPPDLILRLAALFHDSGKPATLEIGAEGIPSFHRHEFVSESLAKAALRRLRFPNDIVAEVCHLVAMHMFHYTPDWTDAAVRRFVAKAGPEHLDALLRLRMADSAATAGLPPDPKGIEEFKSRISEVAGRDTAFGLKDLAVGGDDLAGIGVPTGPAMGEILRELLETVLDDPGQNTREGLLRIAAALKERRGL